MCIVHALCLQTSCSNSPKSGPFLLSLLPLSSCQHPCTKKKTSCTHPCYCCHVPLPFHHAMRPTFANIRLGCARSHITAAQERRNTFMANDQ
ncbi:unnamed protein product [Chondrus crispus]|uniref:Uncharacterized protein n=1 Tax=Chondrus crispus TaxID=2769 RepID=R7QIU9_CHOCR|nr:unnamed protein product [Chondrus crispus]CDF37350.1 unnamed protein product [Chondrus crispus]|eukprot:XP_005717169.1 unnamed protein product [Chondrus crispus]